MIDLKKSLKDYGVSDGDMVMMDRMRRQAPPRQAVPRPAAGAASSWDFSQIQIPTNLLGGGGGAGASGSRAASSGAGTSQQPRNEE